VNVVLTDKEKSELKLRLKKIAGQINGIDKMLDDGRYCVDVVQQILAARAALNKVSLIIMESHAKSCMVTAIKDNRAEQSIEELMQLLKQFTK
jgi:DNA-binding FrmR family transcriptional regulator